MTVTTRQLLAGSLFAALLISAACQQQPQAANKPAAPTVPATDQAALIKRGEYIVTTGFCHDCHTPFKMGEKGPEPDMSRALSGHPENLKVSPPPKPTADWPMAFSPTNTAWAGPWGITYSANITSDENTGIGIWDEAMFIKSMREGRHMGNGRPILPPMPWPWIAKRTDDDLKAIFAYLKSTTPIANHVPDAVIADHLQ